MAKFQKWREEYEEKERLEKEEKAKKKASAGSPLAEAEFIYSLVNT